MDGSKVESGLQLFARLSQRPSLNKLHATLFSEGGPFPNDFIEITGGPGAGKTLLIMDLLARCLLPEQCSGVNISGKNCGAVLIDTDHHFDLFKLIEIMEYHIKKCCDQLVKVSQSSIENIIKSCLDKLIILSCYDSNQFQMTFLNLETILSENLNIGLVAVDSISSYYWEYRHKNGIISLQSYHMKMLQNLQNSVRNSNVVTTFTRTEVDITLDSCWKITLNEFGNIFQAHVVNNKKHHKTMSYVIERTIKFLSDYIILFANNHNHSELHHPD